MVTIRDVAAAAGVSVATVSNALNSRPNVSEATRAEVKRVASEMGYVPNKAAQAMVRQYTKSVCVIVSGPASFKVFTNPIFSEVIRTVTATLAESDYEVILRVVSNDDERQLVTDIARGRGADGIIYIGTRHTDQELTEIFHDLSIPVVVLIRQAPSSDFYSVSADNYRCGFSGTEQLLREGHRDIAFVGVLPNSSMAGLRAQGYRDALLAAGITPDPTLQIEGDYYQESGFRAGITLHELSQHTAVTAAYVANDLMALGTIEGLESKGLSVPRDMSIVGTDGIANLHLLRVPLTSMETDFAAIGVAGAQKLIEILRGVEPEVKQSTIEPRLRVRGSTAHPLPGENRKQGANSK